MPIFNILIKYNINKNKIIIYLLKITFLLRYKKINNKTKINKI